MPKDTTSQCCAETQSDESRFAPSISLPICRKPFPIYSRALPVNARQKKSQSSLDISPFLTSLAETSAITAFAFNNILDSPRLSRNPFIFKHSSRSMVSSFLLPFVFNNSSRSSFISNIFLGQRPLSDLDQHMGQPPHLQSSPEGAAHPSPGHRPGSGGIPISKFQP